MQPESRASKVKRFSEAALFHLEDVSDPGTKALTFALIALRRCFRTVFAGQRLGKSVVPMWRSVERHCDAVANAVDFLLPGSVGVANLAVSVRVG